MKKILPLFLVLVLIFSFSACNDKTIKTDTEATKNNTTENSVEKIYDNFIKGKTTAVYADGSNINIDYLLESSHEGTLKYALFDRNGDSVPELCFNNEMYITTFWVSDGTLKLWHEENFNSKMLSNGNCLETHHGGAPNHADYSYIIYSYSGEVVSNFCLSVLTKNGIDVLENIYTQTTTIFSKSTEVIGNTIEITKEQFDTALASIEAIGESEVSWITV